MIIDLVTGVVLHLGLAAPVMGWTQQRPRRAPGYGRTHPLFWGAGATLTGPYALAGAVAYGPRMTDVARANFQYQRMRRLA